MIDQLLAMSKHQYDSYEQILVHQQNNFAAHIKRNKHNLGWWFGNVSVDSLEDLSKLPVRTAQHILDEQQKRPPYGLWSKGQIVFNSSGSTNNVRKIIPRSLEDYYRYIVSVSRSLENNRVDYTDSVMSTDAGGMFSGHVAIEDAATYILGATRIKCNSPLPSEKLKVMDQFGVTVFSGSPTKLLRMAKLNPKQWLSKPMKMIISTGGVLENPEIVADAFGVNHVTNLYGSAELGNIAWTCKHQQFHVNIDLCYVEQGKYFSNLTNLPLFRYEQGEQLSFSYKGTCACGSNLPTMDSFITSNINRKDKN